MEEITVKAKTKDQAIAKALQKLGATREEVEVRVLAEGQPGFLGWFGIFPARVKVTRRQDDRGRAANYLKGILDHMGIESRIQAVDQGEEIRLNVSTESDGGLLIGHHGKTLRAIQYLLGRVLSDGINPSRGVQIDVNGYLKEREDELRDRARELARRAVEEHRILRTAPLPPSERRLIHETLREDDEVESQSVGHGNMKPVAIAPKGMQIPSRSPDRDSRPHRRDEGRRRRSDGPPPRRREDGPRRRPTRD